MLGAHCGKWGQHAKRDELTLYCQCRVWRWVIAPLNAGRTGDGHRREWELRFGAARHPMPGSDASRRVRCTVLRLGRAKAIK
uniref:Uncharacterized protein n=1 Tax=Pseudomonas fluorescens (strain SBW25) TaxID=216595 RepID=A0A0G4E5E5_PSEFS|nr:hypothetical protein PQBR57_0244 [Pseudomonas fluorescens SBW25]